MARCPGPSGVVCSQPTATQPRADGQPPGPGPGCQRRPPHSQGRSWAFALLAPGLASALGLALPSGAAAGPVVCVSSLEAPLPAKGASGSLSSSLSPVVVTRCGPVVTTPQLVERRAYTWTAPFAQGVDLVHQVTDVLGIAVAGRHGTTLMGLGFPDQTLVWDASAIEATNRVLLEAQSNPMPLRTADAFNGYCSGLAQGGCGLPGAEETPGPTTRPYGVAPAAAPVRGLW